MYSKFREAAQKEVREKFLESLEEIPLESRERLFLLISTTMIEERTDEEIEALKNAIPPQKFEYILTLAAMGLVESMGYSQEKEIKEKRRAQAELN